MASRLSPGLDAQLAELLRDVGAGGGGADGLVDEEDLAVGPDVESPAVRDGPGGVDDAVRRGGCLGRIREDRIVGAQRLGELLVRLGVVDAGGEVVDVELPDVVAALTERLALGRSTAGKGFREPGEDHRLAAELRELPRLAVRADEREVGSCISHLQLHSRLPGGQRRPGQSDRRETRGELRIPHQHLLESGHSVSRST
jgi:hypothetical protein